MTEFTPADLRPAEVEAYLESRNWEFLREVTNGTIWVAPSGAEEAVNVFVPTQTEFGDYNLRVLEVVHAVSEAERRSEQEVIRDLVEVSADVIRFRLPSTFPDASVRLADAMTLFQRAKAALRAAALAAHRPSIPAYPASANPGPVDGFLRELRVGHTEPGSFVVPVIAPLGTVEGGPDEVVPRTDEPFGRFAVLRFTSALSAVEEALQATRQTNDLLPFTEAVASGVSANFCIAISEMTRITGADRSDEAGLPSIMIGVSWSPSRPVPDDTRSAFVVAGEDASLLKDASEFLRRAEARPRVAMIGQVVRLEREQDEPDGAIGIRGRIDDQDEVRMLVVRLSPIDYERALHAHDHRLEVSCSGVLERHGTRWRLAEPIDFQAPDALF